MTRQTPVQAAVLQMLIAKRPRLGQLPIDWMLHADGGLTAMAPWGTEPAEAIEIAQEIARALRGGKVEIGEDRTHSTSGRPYRIHHAYGTQNGVSVSFQTFEYLDGHGDKLPEGGETA